MNNRGNGTNYMTQLVTAFKPRIPGPSTLLSPPINGLTDNPLEYLTEHQPSAGSAPMDLETVIENEYERDNRMKNIDRRNMKLESSRERERSCDRKLDDSSGNSVDSQEKNLKAVTTNMNMTQSELMFNGLMGPQRFMMIPGMMNMMDPTLLGLPQFPIMNQLTTLPTDNDSPNTLVPIKEIITCKSCTLFPPTPNAPPPTTRERPPGCRTVFVGGLPENILEEVIREVFDRCGEITTLRLSKKNFCHIRFAFEASVDSAIYLSGYRIKIGNSAETLTGGRLHVDYAQARDDQYEWECRQRQLQREQRHKERLERDRLRPVSPPPIVHYTDHEAISVSEKLKSDESFAKAMQVLVTWLERGDCSKKNANSFYSMIQSTNSHVRRLLGEKGIFEDELQMAKDHYRTQMQTMMLQCEYQFISYYYFVFRTSLFIYLKKRLKSDTKVR